MVLTGRPMDAAEAYAHGVVSPRRAHADALEATAFEMAEKIAAAPTLTINLARRVIKHLADPEMRSSMADEQISSRRSSTGARTPPSSVPLARRSESPTTRAREHVPVDLRALVDPAHTALVTCEMQRGIIGDHAVLRDLADEVTAIAMVPPLRRAARRRPRARLARRARAHRVPPRPQGHRGEQPTARSHDQGPDHDPRGHAAGRAAARARTGRR